MTLVGAYVALSKPLVAAMPVFLLAWLRFGIGALAMPHWLKPGPQEPPLPEYFPIIGAADADRVRAREDFGQGPIQDWLAETAQRFGIWVLPYRQYQGDGAAC